MRKNIKPFVPYWLLRAIAWVGFVGLPIFLFFIPNAIEVYRGVGGGGLAILNIIFGAPVLIFTSIVLYLILHKIKWE